jgi:16S rRNA (cytidine1402-2'-O)-methyltransferase
MIQPTPAFPGADQRHGKIEFPAWISNQTFLSPKNPGLNPRVFLCSRQYPTRTITVETNEPDKPTRDGGNTAQPGHLYVVATPIGNLSDITMRAASLLATCDLVACEDTRTSGILLAELGFKKNTTSYHEHNEKEKVPWIVGLLQEGKSVCLISDAGTPAISDPGFRLVRECRRLGLPVVPAPGASAVVAALSASGLPTNGFLYVGFLPPKSAARRRFLETYREFPFTVCLYESSHRIEKLMAELLDVLGPDRSICLAKEITKRHETFLVGEAGEVMERFRKMSLKGEFVLLIAPAEFTLTE